MRFSALLWLVSFSISAPVLGLSQVAAPSPKAASSGATPAPEVAESEASMAKSDWKDAEAKLGAWLSSHPDDARALFDAGYAADAQNHVEQAENFYRRATEANPNSFEAHLSLGLLLARSGRPEEARPELAAATQLDPGDAGPVLKARAWRALARIDRGTNPTAASDDLLEALKISPETAEDTLLAAEVADAAGDRDAAEAAYRRLLAKEPKLLAANTGLAHVLIARKQFPEAETLLRGALRQTPDDPTLTAQLATVLAAQDKPEALPLLQKLHAAHPDEAVLTKMLAEVLSESGDAAGADQLYVLLLAKHPADPALLIGHGQSLIRQQKYPEALSVFTKATELDGENPDGWSGLAFAASKNGQPSITLHALTMRSKYLSENSSTYFLWATSYDTLQNRTAAITYYHHFLEAAAGKFPNQEWQARQRLLVLEKK